MQDIGDSGKGTQTPLGDRIEEKVQAQSRGQFSSGKPMNMV